MFNFDYIRIYQNITDKVNDYPIPESNNISSLQICNEVMPTIRPNLSLKLIFSDEFNSIDHDKWHITHYSKKCNEIILFEFLKIVLFLGDFLSQLNCFTKQNLRIINGTLALTAIRETYLNKYYTSAHIISKVNFTYGRIEIKASEQ